MSVTSSQTANGMVTLVTMVKVDGNPPLTVAQVGGENFFPNASGQITVSAEYVPDLTRAGWGVVISSGGTHVP